MEETRHGSEAADIVRTAVNLIQSDAVVREATHLNLVANHTRALASSSSLPLMRRDVGTEVRRKAATHVRPDGRTLGGANLRRPSFPAAIRVTPLTCRVQRWHRRDDGQASAGEAHGLIRTQHSAAANKPCPGTVLASGVSGEIQLHNVRATLTQVMPPRVNPTVSLRNCYEPDAERP